MLSVIICSKEPDRLTELRTNILSTIGVENEIVVIDNSANNYSIFQAYNEGIKRSSGEFLCFLHEDIKLHTADWGKILLELFSIRKDVGLIGVAGSKIKTSTPSAWWNCPQTYRAINILQHIDKKTKDHWNYGFNKAEEEVVALDGVFMAALRDPEIRFNEKLSGFHNYDLSFCLDYLKAGYKLMVTSNILLEHYSMGKLNQSWYESSLKLHNQYKDCLPQRTGDIPEDAAKRLEFSNHIIFIEGLLDKRMKKQAIREWLSLLGKKPVARVHYKILKMLLK